MGLLVYIFGSSGFARPDIPNDLVGHFLEQGREQWWEGVGYNNLCKGLWGENYESKVTRKIRGWDIASLASVPFPWLVRRECVPKPVGSGTTAATEGQEQEVERAVSQVISTAVPTQVGTVEKSSSRKRGLNAASWGEEKSAVAAQATTKKPR